MFDTYDPGVVDARVQYADGRPVGPSFTAQLFGGPLNTPKASLTPLVPVTHFMTGGGAQDYYVKPVKIVVPGVLPGQQGTFLLRVYNGPSWEKSSVRGESGLFTPILGTEAAPFGLAGGLEGFTVAVVPEPGTVSLALALIVVLGSRWLWTS